MKFLTLAFLSLVSVSSFAATVRCDIYKYEKDETVTPVDYVLLGNVEGKDVYSVRKQVNGLENTFVNVSFEKGMFISLTLIKGSPVIDEKADVLIEAGVQGAGFQIRNRNAEVAVTCGTYNQ